MGQLGKTQKEILSMLLNEGLTQKQISERRQTSKQAVSKIIKKLKKKGYLEAYKRGGLTKRGTVVLRGLTNLEKEAKLTQVWRYHALEFKIMPYYFTDKYYKILKQRGGKSIVIGNWRFQLYYKKIICWLQAGLDFIEKDIDKVLVIAMQDFNKALSKASQRFGFKIFKDGRAGVKLIKHHLAKTNAPEYETITEKEIYVQFKRDDGKVFLQYDRSKGVGEREYITDSVTTADKVEVYFKDFERNQPLTNSQLQSRLVDLLTVTERLTEAVKRLRS